MAAPMPSVAAMSRGRRCLHAVLQRKPFSSHQCRIVAPFTSAASAATKPAAPDSLSPPSPASPPANLAADYVPRWRYQPSSTQTPTRNDVRHTYRALLRLVFKTAQGQQQLWASQRSAHWQGPGSDAQQQQANKSAMQLFEYSDHWLAELRKQYRAHQHERDERRIATLHSDAVEYLALLEANLEHSREVYEAGWGMQQATKAHISNTARRVGLQTTASTLDREVAEELRAEAKERGEGEGNVDETIARLEAVERRKRKEVEGKSKASSKQPPADSAPPNGSA